MRTPAAWLTRGQISRNAVRSAARDVCMLHVTPLATAPHLDARLCFARRVSNACKRRSVFSASCVMVCCVQRLNASRAAQSQPGVRTSRVCGSLRSRATLRSTPPHTLQTLDVICPGCEFPGHWRACHREGEQASPSSPSRARYSLAQATSPSSPCGRSSTTWRRLARSDGPRTRTCRHVNPVNYLVELALLPPGAVTASARD